MRLCPPYELHAIQNRFDLFVGRDLAAPHRGASFVNLAQLFAGRTVRAGVDLAIDLVGKLGQVLPRLPRLPLVVRRRDPHLVESGRVHRVGLAHQDVGRDLVFGAPELSERGKQCKVVERLDRESQTQRPRFRSVFRSRHATSSLGSRP
jgi:hypothetical protein